MLTTSGNHEEQATFGAAWYGSSGYKARLLAALPSRVSSRCSGSYGERYECSYGGSDAHHFVLLGWKQMADRSESAASAAFVQRSFAGKPGSKWRHCVFHKPEGLVNPGDKHTATYGNYDVYEACRRAGAIITSGHSHVYSRTKLISQFGESSQVVASDDAASPAVRCGATVSFVLGSSGFKHDASGPNAGRAWFRKVLTRSDLSGDRAGALICDYGSDAASTSAQCEYRLASVNTVVDSFTLASSLCAATSAPTAKGSGSGSGSPPTGVLPTRAPTPASPSSSGDRAPTASPGSLGDLAPTASPGSSGDLAFSSGALVFAFVGVASATAAAAVVVVVVVRRRRAQDMATAVASPAEAGAQVKHSEPVMASVL